jgi:hypothetical protein
MNVDNISMCHILDQRLHPLGQVVFFQGQKCGVTLDLCEKMRKNESRTEEKNKKNTKNSSQKHPFSDSF